MAQADHPIATSPSLQAVRQRGRHLACPATPRTQVSSMAVNARVALFLQCWIDPIPWTQRTAAARVLSRLPAFISFSHSQQEQCYRTHST